MAFIPLVCGTYSNLETVGVGGDCPVCRSYGSVELERTYETACFCFLPLCKAGPDAFAARCRSCNSRMPPAMLVQQRGFVPLVRLPFATPFGSPLNPAPLPPAQQAAAAADPATAAAGGAPAATSRVGAAQELQHLREQRPQPPPGGGGGGGGADEAAGEATPLHSLRM